MIDGRGERIVWLVRAADSGFDVFEAQLSDTRGIVGFSAAQRAEEGMAPARRARRRRRAHGGGAHLGAPRAPAHRRGLSAHDRQPGAFRPRSSRARGSAWATHEAEGATRRSTRRRRCRSAEARARLATLHALPELRTWIPPEESLPALDLEIGNIVTSKLIVDPAQRQEQLAAAMARIANEALTPDYRALLASRLRETALLLASRGQLDEARLCSTAAELTLDGGVAAADNPFVLQLFEKVVKVPEAEPCVASRYFSMLRTAGSNMPSPYSARAR